MQSSEVSCSSSSVEISALELSIDGEPPCNPPNDTSLLPVSSSSPPVVEKYQAAMLSTTSSPSISPSLSSPSSPSPIPQLPSLVPHGVHPLYYSLYLLRTRQYDRVIDVAAAYRNGEREECRTVPTACAPHSPTTTPSPSSILTESDKEQLWFVQTKAMILNSWYNDVELNDEEDEEDEEEGRDEGRGGTTTAGGSSAGLKTAYFNATTGPNATALVPLSTIPGGRPMSTRYGTIRPGTNAWQATRPGQLPLGPSSRAGGGGKLGSRLGTASTHLPFSRSGTLGTATSRYQRLGTASLQSVPGGPHIVLERLRLEKYAKERPMITKLLCDYLLYVEHRPRMVLELCRAVMMADQDEEEDRRRHTREQNEGGGGRGGGGALRGSVDIPPSPTSTTTPLPPGRSAARSPSSISRGRSMFPAMVVRKETNERVQYMGRAATGRYGSPSSLRPSAEKTTGMYRGRSNPRRRSGEGNHPTDDDDDVDDDNDGGRVDGGTSHVFSSPPPPPRPPSSKQIGITASEDWWWKARYGKANYQLGLWQEAVKWFQWSLFGGNGIGGGGGGVGGGSVSWKSGSEKKAFKEYHSSVVMELGKAYQRMDQPLSTIDLYHKALAHHPQDAAVARNLARLLETLHDASGAFELFSSVLAYDSQNVEAIACVAAFYFYERNQPECSLRFYRRLLQMGVHQPEVWNNMALSACLSCQFDLAFSYFGRALQACEEHRSGETMIAADVWYNMSHAGIALGELAFAQKALWIAVRLDETHGEAWNNLAVLTLESGALSMEKKKSSGKKKKKKKRNNNNNGSKHSQNKENVVEKEESYINGTERDAEGVGMKAVEEEDEEEEEEKNGGGGGAFSSPFVANVDEDTKEEAKELLSMCLSIAPSLEEALYNSAWLKYAVGELEEAYELLVRTLEIHPDHPESLALLTVLRKRLHF